MGTSPCLHREIFNLKSSALPAKIPTRRKRIGRVSFSNATFPLLVIMRVKIFDLNNLLFQFTRHVS